MVEVAYQVLVEKRGVDGDFDPNECKEFVEQCKACAGQLAEEERRYLLKQHESLPKQ